MQDLSEKKQRSGVDVPLFIHFKPTLMHRSTLTAPRPLLFFLNSFDPGGKGQFDTVTNGSIRTLELLSGNRRARTQFLGDESGVEAVPTLIVPLPRPAARAFFSFFLASVAEL